MKKTFLIISLLCLLALFASLLHFQRSVAKSDGSYDLKILTSEVKVYKDSFGIPHIEATDDEDAYRVLGFVFASERLFQMDVLRRLVNGQLSEIFGEKTVKADTLLRKMRLRKSAEKYLALNKNNKELKKPLSLLDAFREGVHYYMESQTLPVEFSLFGYEPRKFTNAEIIGVSSYMSLGFAEEIKVDSLNSKLAERLPKDKLAIIKSSDNIDFTYYKDQKIVNNLIYKEVSNAIEEIEKVYPLFQGSNSWILSGKKTVSGKPVLANDPHIGVSNPHIFIEAHIKMPSFEIYGHFIPLNPFAVLGHTPYSAWGITMGEIDIMNLYEEKINPQNKDEVMYKGEWVPLVKSTEVIKVKDGKDISIAVDMTPHGPLINGTSYEIPHKKISVNWTVDHPENHVLLTFYKLAMARKVSEFKQALSYAAAPSLNISWVNTEGDIAWWMMGKYPRLADGLKTNVVLKGWDGKNDIEDYYTFDENPHLVNPDRGIIVTANYKPQLDGYEHFQGYWQPAGRYFRIEKLLKQNNKISIQDIKDIQNDVTIPGLSVLKKNLVGAIVKTKFLKKHMNTLSDFNKWNGSCDTESSMCTLYHMWLYRLYRNTYLDELGEEDYQAFGKTPNFDFGMKKLLTNKDHSFWDDIRTERVENGSDIITRSFIEAYDKLENKLGVNTKKWTWGKLHQVEYIHPVGRVRPLNYIFNIGPYPVSGGRYLINNMGHKKYTDDFSVVHAPSTRRIIDMSNPRNSLGIIPTGNSGNVLSRHYSDQTSLYIKGKYRAQLMNWEKIRKLKLLLFKAER